MKELFHEFGYVMLAIITAVLVLGVMFGVEHDGKKGIFEILGMSVEKTETDYSDYRDFDAVVVWYRRTRPEASYFSALSEFITQETTGFLDRFYAEDMEESIYPMEQVILSRIFPDTLSGNICDVRDSAGNSMMYCYDAASGSICFPSAGRYEVDFYTVDRENAAKIWRIPIAVNQRRHV